MSFTPEEINMIFDPVITDNAAFSHAGGSPMSISVIYDNAYLASLGIESSAPVAICRTSDIASVSHGDTLTIAGITYYIVGIQEEDQFTTLILSRNKDG